MARRRKQPDDRRARVHTAIVFGALMVAILALGMFFDQRPYHWISQWGPGWTCLNGSYGICFKKDSPNSH